MSEKNCVLIGLVACLTIFVGVVVWFFNTAQPTWSVGWGAWLAMAISGSGVVGFWRDLSFLRKEPRILEEWERSRWRHPS